MVEGFILLAYVLGTGFGWWVGRTSGLKQGIAPHLGSSTKHTRIAMANLAIDNIDEFFKTGNCKNKVN